MNALNNDDDVTLSTEPPRPAMRVQELQRTPRRWPGWLVAGLIGAALAALAISSLYDSRSLGTRLDASVDAAQANVQQQMDVIKGSASAAAQGTAMATERVVDALGDAGITAAVKTALAADPTLSATKIDVSTQGGVVRLDGPAPDEKARQRAEVLAAAPQGVKSVDNRLSIPGTLPLK
jgi:hyperosmotically inducible periplasmic protein